MDHKVEDADFQSRKGRFLLEFIEKLRPDLVDDFHQIRTEEDCEVFCRLVDDAAHVAAAFHDHPLDADFMGEMNAALEAYRVLEQSMAPLPSSFDILRYLKDWHNYTKTPLKATKLRCPACGQPLYVTGYARLESLSEHVCDPNGVSSIKRAYGCLNTTSCKAAQEDCMWAGDGSYYGPKDYKQFPGPGFGKSNEYYGFKNGNNGAFGSFDRENQVQTLYKKSRTFYPLMVFWPVWFAVLFCRSFWRGLRAHKWQALLSPRTWWDLVYVTGWTLRQKDKREVSQTTKDLKVFDIRLNSTPIGDEDGQIVRWKYSTEYHWNGYYLIPFWRRVYLFIRTYRHWHKEHTSYGHEQLSKYFFKEATSYWSIRKDTKWARASRWLLQHVFWITARQLKNRGAKGKV